MHWKIISIFCLVFSLVAAGIWLTPYCAWADENDKTFPERKHERAILLREQAKDRAAARLGYEDIASPYADRYVDYYTIGQQISRLTALLEALSAPARTPQRSQAVPPPLGLLGDLPRDAVQSVYGPDGPTKKSVRLLLEYRLMVTGNPRLTIGKVTESEDRVKAQVVTLDGSLVEEFIIDKKTGRWRPVR